MIDLEGLTIKAAIHTGREIKLKKGDSVYKAALMIDEDVFPPEFVTECKKFSAQRNENIWEIACNGDNKNILVGTIKESFWVLDEEKNLRILHIKSEEAKEFSVISSDGTSLGSLVHIF